LENRTLTSLSVCDVNNTALGLKYFIPIVKYNTALTTLRVFSTNEGTGEVADFAGAILALVSVLHLNKSLECFQLSGLAKPITKLVRKALKENGSLVDFGGGFAKDIMARNQRMRRKALAGAKTVLLVRQQTREITVLHCLVKDVVRIIAKKLWETRAEIETWDTKQMRLLRY